MIISFTLPVSKMQYSSTFVLSTLDMNMTSYIRVIPSKTLLACTVYETIIVVKEKMSLLNQRRLSHELCSNRFKKEKKKKIMSGDICK